MSFIDKILKLLIPKNEQSFNAQENFRILVGEVFKEVNKGGWKQSRNSFYLQQSGNTAVINFQKSNSSTSQALSFVINLGIYSSKLARALGETQKEFPNEYDCHWRQRLGFLLYKEDKWWTLDSTTNFRSLSKEITTAISDTAIPIILENIADESLMALWSGNQCPGLTEQQRKEYLESMKKIYGTI